MYTENWLISFDDDSTPTTNVPVKVSKTDSRLFRRLAVVFFRLTFFFSISFFRTCLLLLRRFFYRVYCVSQTPDRDESSSTRTQKNQKKPKENRGEKAVHDRGSETHVKSLRGFRSVDYLTYLLKHHATRFSLRFLFVMIRAFDLRWRRGKAAAFLGSPHQIFFGFACAKTLFIKPRRRSCFNGCCIGPPCCFCIVLEGDIEVYGAGRGITFILEQLCAPEIIKLCDPSERNPSKKINWIERERSAVFLAPTWNY